MVDLWLIAALGFLGSFGHCAAMCGPIAVAFSLAGDRPNSAAVAEDADSKADCDRWHHLQFHLMLNAGRIVSYALVGATIGALGSVLLAGGNLAGVGSSLRQGISLLTGLLLIWMGLSQVNPHLLPKLPLLNPMAQGRLHERLSAVMVRLSLHHRWWTPALLGMVWGLIPCGFLYAAQIKAAEAGSLWLGSATMLAFGLGTLPVMLGVGAWASAVSGNRRSQLFRMGGWVTLVIGVLCVLRTGNTMTDYTGYLALLCLALALVARPVSKLWAFPLRCRRALGVMAFVLSLAHTIHMVEHNWGWNFEAIAFLQRQRQLGLGLGAIALSFMLPAALTSFDWAQQRLGRTWRQIHLLSVPALVLCGLHCILTGSHFLGTLQPTAVHWGRSLGVGLLVVVTLLVRWRTLWRIGGLADRYTSAPSAKVSTPMHTTPQCSKPHTHKH
ncbi:sulfite exporter TauE/SafE family protein [Leptolyngbya sp. AN02str]|uniref:urease accessory protein UreH domain-containing protein n=1 Tax=Leptolyngbya sp. AN02str TaxID=3423363 RepID=UPI003D31E868